MQLIPQPLSSSKRIYSEWLKLFAILFMIIDHIGLVFYPDQQLLRQIGRLAFPIFAYQITLGFHLTSNRKKMLQRLVAFAFLSAIPYFLMTGSPTLNIFFTLSLGFVAMWIVQERKFVFLPLILAFPFFIPIDYGIYGLLTILFFYLLRNNFLWQLLAFFALTYLYVQLGAHSLQINAIFGLLLVPILLQLKDRFHIHKYFYYVFYPAHMLLLWLINITLT